MQLLLEQQSMMTNALFLKFDKTDIRIPLTSDTWGQNIDYWHVCQKLESCKPLSEVTVSLQI